MTTTTKMRTYCITVDGEDLGLGYEAETPQDALRDYLGARSAYRDERRSLEHATYRVSEMATSYLLGPDVVTYVDSRGRLHQGHVTTEHASSSYGMPVLIDREGQPLGPAEIGAILAFPDPTEGQRSLLDDARTAGYRVDRQYQP
jgi:hypothetical protein